MRWWPRVSSCRHVGKNIKYTVALFSALDVSVRKKTNVRLARFSLHFARNRMTPCVANVHGSHYTSTYFILSRLSDRLIFRNSLSLFGASIQFRKKPSTCHMYMYSTLLRIALRVSTCRIHVQLAESRPCHLGGYIYSIGLVKAVSESLQELVRASSSSLLVTLNNV